MISLLSVCEEIAADPRCDLVLSSRRIRLYSAMREAQTIQDGEQSIRRVQSDPIILRTVQQVCRAAGCEW